MKNLQRALSLLLVLSMVLTCLPMPALAEEAGCDHHVHDDQCGYVVTAEDMGCGFVCDVCAEENTGTAAVTEVKALINAMPSLDAIQSKTLEEQLDDYNKVQSAYDAYEKLTENQKAQISDSAEVFESYFAYFNNQIAVDNVDKIADGTCGENLTWMLNHDGILTISGTGAMDNFIVEKDNGIYYPGTSPWFDYQNQIKHVIIEEGVTTIGTCAFSLSSVLEDIVIPDGITTIGEWAFDDCVELKTVILPDSLKTIEGFAFSGSGLTEIIIPDSVTKLGGSSFLKCSDLANVELSNNITEIPRGAFAHCAFTHFEIPSSVMVIGFDAFYNCTALTSIIIPDSVTTIMESAFSDCSSLQSITFEGNAPEFYFDGSPDEPQEGNAFDNVVATAYYPSNNSTWTEDVMQNYGGTITWKPYTPGEEPDDTEPENEPCRLDELEELDYLAFSQVAYVDFIEGETVQECLVRTKKWDKEWGADGITYAELCRRIANWPVYYIPESYSAGFYAVAFKNNDGDAVLAYRGSKPTNPLTDEDAFEDWVVNDLPMILLNASLPGNQYDQAMDAYKELASDPEINTICVTGHSLGGLWGDVVSAYSGCEGVTFNSISALDLIFATHHNQLAESFKGIDKWNFVDHVNQYDILAGMTEVAASYLIFGTKLKPYVKHESNYGTFNIAKNHSLNTLVSRDGDKLKINDVKGSWKGTSGISNRMSNLFDWLPDMLKYIPNQAVDMGVSTWDEFKRGLSIDEYRTSYGGDGNDEIISSILGDTIIGGNGNDTLNGRFGPDTYVYYKGNGMDTIRDIGGQDTLILKNFDDDDYIEVFEDQDSDYIYINCNGEDIVRIHKDNREYGAISLNSFKVYINGKENDITRYFNRWHSGSSLLVHCPVNVEVLDSEGNIVYTVEDGSEGEYYTEYGNFYVFKEDDGGFGKTLDLAKGYTVRIVGVDDGTMAIDYREVVDGELGEPKNFVDVPISSQFAATFEETEDGELVLAADTDGDGTVDAKLGYDGMPIEPEAVKITQEYITLKPGETIQLTAQTHPAELVEVIQWSLESEQEPSGPDEDGTDRGDIDISAPVVSVDEKGVVTAIAPGTDYVIATVTDGEVSCSARCRVDVAETELPEVEEPGEPGEGEAAPVIKLEGIQLSTTKLTTELYSTDYAGFEILLQLPQNYSPAASTYSLRGRNNNGVTMESARFTDPAVAELFELQVLDDRRVLVIPTDKAIQDAQTNAKSVKSSYSSPIEVTVAGQEDPIPGQETMTLTVKKTLPKLKVSIAAFNSFYPGQSQTIQVTGGTVTRIEQDSARGNDALPGWLELTEEAGAAALTLNGETPKSSGKAYLEVYTEEWAIPARVTLSVKNSYKAPVLKFSASTLTLNKAVESAAKVRVTASVPEYTITDPIVRITGEKQPGELETSWAEGVLTVHTTEKTPDKATYKLYFSTPGCKEVALTVKVVSDMPSVTYKVTGSLDLSMPGQTAAVTPTFKNYNGGFLVEELTAQNAKKTPVDFFGYQQSENGSPIQITCDGETPVGSYTLTLRLKLDNGSTVQAAAKVTVKHTSVKLKLSASKISLNKNLGQDHFAVIDVTSATKDYKLEYGTVTVTAPAEVDASYAEGKLTVRLKETAAYGATYKVTVQAYPGAPAATFSVAVPAANKSGVTAAIKAAGSIDVIREGTAITVTPTFTNGFASDFAMDETSLTFYKKAGSTYQLTEDVPFGVKYENGQFVITAREGLNHADKYRVELAAKVKATGETVKSKQIDLKVSMGSVKLTTKTSDTTMFAKDRKDRALVWFEVTDASLNQVARLEIKDTKYQDVFEVIEYGNGQFAIGFKGETIHKDITKQLEKKTNVSIPLNLNVFLEGNHSAKANTTAKVTLNVVK